MNGQRWGLAAAVCLTGCIEFASQTCEDGQICPSDRVCVTDRGCVALEQLEACEGVPDGQACEVEVGFGLCRAGLCEVPRCGDGIVDPDEICDDGGNANGDGCSADCDSDESCGNGVRDLVEECDDGNLADHDGCQARCIVQRCGDQVVDPAEVCDDGGNADGDGCSADCESDETCGNGRLDAAAGEACDDSGWLTHDGCDSACAIESFTWQSTPMRPLLGGGAGALEETTGDYVHVEAGVTWAWDGTQWSVRGRGGPAPQYSRMAFDLDRDVLVLFGVPVGDGEVHAWRWEGSSWVPESITGTLTGGVRTVAYDAARSVFWLNTFTGCATWSPGTGAAADSDLCDDVDVMAFDRTSGTMIGLSFGSENRIVPSQTVPAFTFEWGDTGPTVVAISRPADALPLYGVTLIHGGPLGRILAVAGGTPVLSPDPQETGTEYESSIVAWDGAAWIPIDVGSFLPREQAGAGYDVLTDRLVVIGGTDWVSEFLPVPKFFDVWERTAAGWVEARPAPAVRSGHATAFDPIRGRLVLFGGLPRWIFPTNETWTWDGDVWTQETPTVSPPASAGAVMAYDPVRAAVIAYVAGQTWAFTDDWMQLPIANPGTTTVRGLGYDLNSRRLVLVAVNQTWTLPSGSDAWVGLDTATATTAVGTMAYDAVNRSIVHVDPGGAVAQLVEDAWQPLLSPGTGYRGAAAHALGAIRMIPSTTSTPSWERRGSTWIEGDSLDVAVDGPVVADPRSDQVLAVGSDGTGLYVVAGQSSASHGDESCEIDADADADGLTDCDDPDCWWACTPTCPPGVSCPA